MFIASSRTCPSNDNFDLYNIICTINILNSKFWINYCINLSTWNYIVIITTLCTRRKMINHGNAIDANSHDIES